MNSEKRGTFRERAGIVLHSIRFRIVLWFTGILAVILLIFSSFLYYIQSQTIQEEAIHELDRRLSGLAANVLVSLRGGTGQISIPNGLLRDTDIFILLSQDGQVLASQGNVSAQDVVKIVSAGLQTPNRSSDTPAIYWTSPSSQNYAFIVTPLQGQMGMVNLLLIFGGILDPTALVRRFLLTLVGGSLLTLVIALVGGFWLADRAMRPVKTITQTARTIGETDLNRRLNMKSKDELGELANTFDAMLARLQAAFERQRQFVADASHELRTPLTIVNLETSRLTASHRSARSTSMV